MTKPTVIDLFAGVGGLSLGFEMAGFDVKIANEFDPSIAEAYTRNRPDTKMVVADIRDLDIEKTFSEYAGKTTIVIGGPPCQGFSQKGQRKSINDPRNFLFLKYYDVVKFVKPKYFVIENVPTLLTTENGYFKNEIVELFSALGYAVNCGVLCALITACRRIGTVLASSVNLTPTRPSPSRPPTADPRPYGTPLATSPIWNPEKARKSQNTATSHNRHTNA